jgi:hypothetical protein
LIGVEFLAPEALLEFPSVSGIRETVDMKPLSSIVDRMTAAAECEIFAEFMNLVVAAALTRARRQYDLVRPIPINGRRRQLALPAHVRTAV